MLRNSLHVLFLATMTTVCMHSQTKIHFVVDTDVNCIVTDTLGRKTGVDSRYSKPSDQYTWIRQIPNSEIGYNTSNEGGPSSLEFEMLMVTPAADGKYTIELIGDTLWSCYLNVRITAVHGGVAVEEPEFDLKRIPIEKDSVVTYIFTYHSAPGAPGSLMKAVSARSMFQDLSAMRQLNWITDQTTVDKYSGLLNTYASQVQQSNVSAARSTLTSILQNMAADSSHTLTADACNLLRPDVQQLLSQLPGPQPGLSVQLANSNGSLLVGGSLQYYEGSWKDAINNDDGTFTVNTTQTTTSLRMTYAYGSQTKSNVPVNGGPVTFQTVNTQIKLQNSQGMAIDTGSVQYYAGAWRSFGTTTNGTASMELLPATYSFRMTYAYGSNDKQQDIGANSTLVFQTVNASVQLQNSQGTPMDQGTVQYYAGAWRDFGSTTNGVATKELLPANYSFRMTYAYASKDKQQNIGTNPTIVFSTVNATVQLKNSLGNLIDQGTVQYYAGAWRSFGTTTNGSATKELLPNNYSFRMTNEFVSNDKQQDIGTNSTVGFSTVLCTVRVSNTAGQLLSGAVVSYYSGAWRQIGTTVDGQITKELLPANLSFRASYGGKSQDKAQNLSTNALVEIILP